jgi:hypothetical protein
MFCLKSNYLGETVKYLLSVCLALLLVACNGKVEIPHSSSFEGTYVSLDGKSSVTFTSDGKVRYGKKETLFSVEGNMIKFQFDGGIPSAFLQNADGSISLNGFEKFKKK